MANLLSSNQFVYIRNESVFSSNKFAMTNDYFCNVALNRRYFSRKSKMQKKKEDLCYNSSATNSFKIMLHHCKLTLLDFRTLFVSASLSVFHNWRSKKRCELDCVIAFVKGFGCECDIDWKTTNSLPSLWWHIVI